MSCGPRQRPEQQTVRHIPCPRVRFTRRGKARQCSDQGLVKGWLLIKTPLAHCCATDLSTLPIPLPRLHPSPQLAIQNSSTFAGSCFPRRHRTHQLQLDPCGNSSVPPSPLPGIETYICLRGPLLPLPAACKAYLLPCLKLSTTFCRVVSERAKADIVCPFIGYTFPHPHNV